MGADLTAGDIRRFLDGDEGVLEQLIRVLGPKVEARLREAFPALRPYLEDLLAESLYRLWTRREKFDPGRGSLVGYWLTIAESAARDLLRANWQQTRARETTPEGDYLEQLAESPAAPFSGAGVGEGSAVPAEERAFWEVFSGLPEVDRHILLHYAQVDGEGHWAVELAQTLNLSPGAIRTRRLRSMERIRQALARKGFTVPPGKMGA